VLSSSARPTNTGLETLRGIPTMMADEAASPKGGEPARPPWRGPLRGERSEATADGPAGRGLI